MKKLILLILSIFAINNFNLIASSFNHAYDIKIGKQPLLIKFDKNNLRLNVFCWGKDANFNGKFDEGDEKPSWWVLPIPGIIIPEINVTDSTFKMMDFEMGALKFPFRAFFDMTKLMDNGSVLISVNDTLKKFSLMKGEILNDNIGVYKTNDVLFKDDRYFLANSVLSKGEILILNGFSALPIDTINLDYTPNGLLHFINHSEEYLAVLCEGTFGKSDSKIEFFKFQNENWDYVKSIGLGSTANYFILDSNRIFVAMNGSHEVQVIDITSLEIIKTLNTGTTLYDGPRELKVLNNSLYVSTYAGDIRRFNLETWGLSSIYEASGKVEGFEFANENYLLAACPFLKDSYEIDSIISVFTTFYDVSENDDDNTLKLNLNNNNINIEWDKIIDYFEIYNSLGEIMIQKTNIYNTNFDLNIDFLNSGIYFIRIKSGNSLANKKILITK